MPAGAISPFEGAREERAYDCCQTTPDHNLLRLDLRAHVGVLAARDLRDDRAAHRCPHRHLHHPRPLGAAGSGLPDDPLARRVDLVGAGHRASAGGPPAHCGAQCWARRSRPLAEPVQPLVRLIVVFAVRLIDPLDGPMGEEPGWRGFALPRLQAERSPLLASLILAVLVTLWHLPLWVLPQFGASPIDILGDILGTVGVTLWYTWLFNHTGGSVLMTIVAHATEGTIQTEAFWSAGAAAARMSLLYGAVWLAVGIGLVIFDRKAWRGPAPAPARVQPANGGESRVR